MDLQNVAVEIKAAQAAGDQALLLIEKYVPSVSAEAALAGVVLDLTAQMVTAALLAWSQASGTAITAESIAVLLPDSTPLSAPDA